MVQPPVMNTFNLGSTLASAAQIQGQRQKNALGAMDVERQKRAEETRMKVKQARQDNETAPAAIKALQEAGNFEAADALIQKHRNDYKQTIDMINGMQGWVRDQEGYDVLRANLLQEGVIEPAEMPVKFESSFFAKTLKETRGKMSTFEQTVGVDKDGVRQMQQVTQDHAGNVLATSPTYGATTDRNAIRAGETEAERLAIARAREARLRKKDANKLAKDAEKGVGPKLPAPYSSGVRAQVASIYDSVFDINSGQIVFKDNANRVQAQQVIEAAEKMLISGDRPSIGTAVAEAARQFGVAIPNQNALNTKTDDVFNLR